MSEHPISIAPARMREDLPAVRTLFRAYAEGLGFDVGFQGFEEEVANLPGAYAEPGGALLLARQSERPIGCVALRPLRSGICEMKRLYVAPGGRGQGLGRRLASAVIAEAAKRGYVSMRLDTVPSMIEAIYLYRRLGFVEIPAYRDNPIEGALFLELDLGRPKDA